MRSPIETKRTARLGFIVQVAVAAVALGVASGARAADALRICSVDDRSGAAADTGNDSFNGLVLAIDAANAAGSIAGRKIELVAYDGKTDSQLTASFATRCAEDDKALMIIGGNPAAPAAAMIAIATQFGIPYYMMSAGTDSLTDPPAPFHFRFGPANRQDAVAIAALLTSSGFRRVAIINNSLPFGTDGARASALALEKVGVKVVTQQTYDVSATDLSPQVINVREAKPDAVLIYPYPADGARVLRTMQQLGVRLPTIMARSALLEGMRRIARDAAAGVLVPNTVDTDRPDVASFFKAYNARFKPAQPTLYPIIGYDAGRLAVKVLAQPEVLRAIDSGTLREARAAIRAATERLGGSYEGLQGQKGATYQFSSTQHHGPPDRDWFVFTQIAPDGATLVKADLAKFKPR
jgi:ABC-type branched-subunit amino acid transport system substrate-binding protein